MNKRWHYSTPGIPDELFIRGDVPMTKREVRAQIVSQLRLHPGQSALDVGAGTGSITVELALQLRSGQVFSLERNPEAVKLIEENVVAFDLANVELVQAEAPNSLLSLPGLDRVVIGGSGGRLPEILETVEQKLNPLARLVIPVVTLTTLRLAVNHLENLKFNYEVMQVAVTRTKKIGDYRMFDALNPIFLITAEKD